MSQDESLPPIEPHNTCKKQPMNARFHITLDREAELVDLVRWMSSITCTKFVWGAKVRSDKVTIISPEKVTIQQAYAAFYAALETMGLTVEESGDYLKIVESNDATREVLPVYKPGQTAPARDRFVTQLYRPHEGRVSDVLAVMEHLKSDRGTVSAVGELIILTDTGSNIRRMLEVVREVDEPQGEGDAIFLHPLIHADPAEIVQVVQEVFMDSTAKGAAPRTAVNTGKSKTKTKAKTKAKATVAPADTSQANQARVSAVSVDLRTRTLVITAPRADYPVVRRLIERLDVAVPDDGGTLFVLPLRHADPEEVAQVLGSLPQGNAAPAGGNATRPGTAGTGVSLGGEIHVTADPATRSLVVMASHHDFLSLKKVVEALDVERRLVYVEAYILELSTKREIGTGASGHFGQQGTDGTTGFVSSSPGNVNSAALDPSVLTGLAAGIIGPGIAGADLFGTGVEIPAFGVVIQALELNEDVNIVSEPHLYTADNKTAKMQIGQNVPVPNGQSSLGVGQGALTQVTYSPRDVTLQLEVTPHVGESGSLTLDILIDDEQLVPSEDESRGPTTSKRRLELEAVVARDGQPVVLGGLVHEKETISNRQVPGLGSIPLLGWLFKSRKKTKEKINLLVVLVPHILQSPDDARRIHERRLNERREFLERESAFKRRDLSTRVNYRHKSGLLAAVNAEASTMLIEADLHQQAQVDLQRSVAEQVSPGGAEELTAPPAGPQPVAVSDAAPVPTAGTGP